MRGMARFPGVEMRRNQGGSEAAGDPSGVALLHRSAHPAASLPGFGRGLICGPPMGI
jgi:hypothetical protein